MSGCLMTLVSFLVGVGFTTTGIYAVTGNAAASAYITVGLMLFMSVVKASLEWDINHSHEQQMEAIRKLEQMLRERRSEED